MTCRTCYLVVYSLIELETNTAAATTTTIFAEGMIWRTCYLGTRQSLIEFTTTAAAAAARSILESHLAISNLNKKNFMDQFPFYNFCSTNDTFK